MGWVEGKMDFLPELRRKDFKEFCDIQTGDSPGIHTDDVGHKWPDFLSNGSVSVISFFVSERVVQNLKDEGIPFRRAIEIPVTSIECLTLKNVHPPKYYILEADIGIDTLQTIENVVVGNLKPGILKGHPDGGTVVQEKIRWRLQYDTWNNAPLFSAKNPEIDKQQYTQLYCDHRVAFLALKEKWTNFNAVEVKDLI